MLYITHIHLSTEHVCPDGWDRSLLTRSFRLQVCKKDQGSGDVGQEFLQVSWNLVRDLLMWNLHGQSNTQQMSQRAKPTRPWTKSPFAPESYAKQGKSRGMGMCIPICLKKNTMVVSQEAFPVMAHRIAVTSFLTNGQCIKLSAGIIYWLGTCQLSAVGTSLGICFKKW